MDRCPLCGGRDLALLYPSTLAPGHAPASAYDCTSHRYGIHPDIWVCLDCTMVFNEPASSTADHLAAYESVEDPDYLEQRRSRRLTYARELDRIEGRVPGTERSLLDVGCYTGFFLELARERGWRVTGIEPGKWAAEQAEARGLHVLNTPIEEFETRERYDVITLWDVLEHLSDPVGALRRLRNVLSDSGILAFTTHNLDSALARLLRGRYPFFMEMHTIHLNNRSLELLLRKTGFELVERHPHRRALRLGYLVSRLRRIGERPAELATLAVERLGWVDRIVWIGFSGLETYLLRRSD